jgi:hypothetical protein
MATALNGSNSPMMKSQSRFALLLATAITVIFCAGFAFFYHRSYKAEQASQGTAVKLFRASIGQQLPNTNLFNFAGVKLEDSALREGKVMLVFVSSECGACFKEGEFLKTIKDRRSDIKFYGVLSFEGRDAHTEKTESIVPFDVFYDSNHQLKRAIGLTGVPVKVFVENGVIRKIWSGATVAKKDQDDFVEWLDSLS